MLYPSRFDEAVRLVALEHEMDEKLITEAVQVHQIEPFIRNACQGYEEGRITARSFNRLVKDGLEDPRIQIAIMLAAYIPIPPSMPESEGDQEAKRLREDFPALYSATTALRSTKLKELDRVEREHLEKLEEDVFLQQRSLARRVADTMPEWWLLLTHHEPQVRLTALGRIPTEHFLAAMIPIMCSDMNKAVRDKARQKLGLKPKRSWTKFAQDVLLRKDAALRAIGEAGPDEVKLKRFLIDHRPGIRFAAATMLVQDSAWWEVVARDPSPRLRTLAATRVKLSSSAFASLLQDKAQRVRSEAGRRQLAAEDPTPAERAERKKRRNWWDE